MRLFRWLSAKPISPACDLRRLGWTLAATGALCDETRRCPVLGEVDSIDEPIPCELDEWRFLPLRSLILLIGVDDEHARARLLRLGFGDVIGSGTSLREIEARALRIAALRELMPRKRQFGELLLDLFAREAFARGRRLGLHPREFALIWRLTDSPGKAVAKKVLIQDVWRMAYVPETNSLAVHVYRLRAKLAAAGLDWMVQTMPDGAYRFEAGVANPPASTFLFSGERTVEDAAFELSVIQGLMQEPQHER